MNNKTSAGTHKLNTKSPSTYFRHSKEPGWRSSSFSQSYGDVSLLGETAFAKNK